MEGQEELNKPKMASVTLTVIQHGTGSFHVEEDVAGKPPQECSSIDLSGSAARLYCL